MLGRVINSNCPECEKLMKAEEEKRQKEQLAENKRFKIARLFSQAGIPSRFQERNFSNYRAETLETQRALKIVKKYADNFEDRLAHGGGLILCGKPGTGKTHLATAIANQVILTGRSVVFTSVMRAIRSVKDTYRKDSEFNEQQAINKYLLPQLLIIDEVGVQFGSDTEKMILFEILNGRYECTLPTILISNLPEKELADYIGERIIDRLKEGGGALIAFDWESYRAKVHKDEKLPVYMAEPVKWD